MNRTDAFPRAALVPFLFTPMLGSASELFARFDRDGDGALSPGELLEARAGAASWIAIDRDRDGRVTRAEFTSLAHAEAPRAVPPAVAAGSASAGATVVPPAVEERSAAAQPQVNVIVVNAVPLGVSAGHYAHPWPPRGDRALHPVQPFDYGPWGVLPPRFP